MKINDIQLEKLNLIAWISQLQDISILKKLKEVQNDTTDIPEWQKKIVRERIKNSKPEEYLSWEEVEKQLRFGS